MSCTSDVFPRGAGDAFGLMYVGDLLAPVPEPATMLLVGSVLGRPWAYILPASPARRHRSKLDLADSETRSGPPVDRWAASFFSGAYSPRGGEILREAPPVYQPQRTPPSSMRAAIWLRVRGAGRPSRRTISTPDPHRPVFNPRVPPSSWWAGKAAGAPPRSGAPGRLAYLISVRTLRASSFAPERPPGRQTAKFERAFGERCPFRPPGDRPFPRCTAPGGFIG